MDRFDAIIVGTGQAGPSLANRFHEQGMRVAIVERDRVGGTCVNTGCIPTKALVASARAAHVARRAGDFGVELGGDLRVDMPRVHARMREISSQSNEGVTKWLEGLENVELIRGDARFASATSVLVGDRTLDAERIFLNVGARPVVPDFEGIEQVDPLTNVDMLRLEELPGQLVVVGGSYIGLEFGQMFRRFGSEVTIVQRGPRLINREDPDVSEAVREILEAEGVVVRTGAECFAVAADEGGVAVRVDCDEGPERIRATHLLVAVGRTPNTDTLDLERAGLSADERGYLRVDDQLRTDVPGIWALGDCNGRGGFTHTSYHDYEVVAANLFDDDPRRVSERIPCYGLFVDPPLGRIGMTETQARASGRRVLIGTRPMTSVGRARERSETQGFMKILVDADTEQILGASILGIRGDEVVQTLLALMYAQASYRVLARGVLIHPTVAELLPAVLQDLRPLEA